MIEVRTLAAGEKISDSGAFSGVSMARYHGPDLCDGPSISSSGLRQIFTDSPMGYWVESPYNPARIDQSDKEHFVLGRACHHLLLGEAEFGKHFSVRPEKWDSWRPNDARGWRSKEQLAGRTVLDPKQIEAIRGMAGLLDWQKDLDDSGLANSALVKSGILNGLIEHTVVYRDEETGIYIKVRPDAIPLTDGVAGDLKTTTAVDYESLQGTINSLRYDVQGALIRMALRMVCGIELTNFALIYVMKTPPYAVQPVEIKTEAMDAAEQDIRVALRTFARCMETGKWPGPGGTQADAMYIEMSGWARKRADARREFLEREIAA